MSEHLLRNVVINGDYRNIYFMSNLVKRHVTACLQDR